MSKEITQARLFRLFDYSTETGIFTWRSDGRCGRGRTIVRAGCEAGTTHSSGRYRAINLDGKPVLVHRLAWLYVHGVWPKNHIDHINGNGLDNRIANLRDVSRSVNLQNMRQAMRDKKHGTLIGAMWHEGTQKWRALIRVNRRQKSLEYFATEQLAHEAYVASKRKFHEGCTI